MTRIFKILPGADWERAISLRRFDGSATDVADGFIHFSTADQLAETARRHFAGQAGLVVLEVEADALGPALRWEPSRGGAPFPHLYGPLEVTHVLSFRPLDAPPS